MAKSGHGATIAIEIDPTMSPGAFTVVGELNGDIKRVMSHDETETTPHTLGDGTVNFDDIYVISPVRKRDPFTWSINFVFGRTCEAALDAAIRNNTIFGIRVRGAGATTTDYWIVSGGMTKVEDSSPVRTGVRTGTYTYRASGPMIVA